MTNSRNKIQRGGQAYKSPSLKIAILRAMTLCELSTNTESFENAGSGGFVLDD